MSKREKVWLNRSLRPNPDLPVIFADRDGTLIRHVDYLGDPSLVELQPGVKGALSEFISRGGAFFLFTNQSGVARGFFDLEDAFACNDRMFELLGIEEAQIAGYCLATGMPGAEDPYRKPSPRFISEASGIFDFDLEHTHMVGDTCVDLETAWASGVHPWLVENGKDDPNLFEKAEVFGRPFHRVHSFVNVIDDLLN